MNTNPLRSAALLPLALASLAPAPAAQVAAPPQRLSREAMWYAPTADDWRKPCRITWQRTLEDALAVSHETDRLLLVCVNMDGEIASEHYAGVRYRDPEIAKLYEPYVCVIASVYRHSPRDHDDEGRRIPCPRFGGVTCGEHIAIEPGLFDRFFEGQRVAPRHIAVDLDQAEMYDVFYAMDTDTVFTALRTGVAGRPVPPPIVRGDRTLTQRVESRDSADRAAVEEAYAGGDRETRRQLLAVAVASPKSEPIGLLRLAIFGLDIELARAARQALLKCESAGAVDLIAEALRVPLDAAEREALIAALERLGATHPKARTLAAVHKGLAGGSQAVDLARWEQALGVVEAYEASAEEHERTRVAARVASSDDLSRARPADAAVHMDLAEGYLELAIAPEAEGPYATLLFEDARRSAREAVELGAQGWRPDSVLAITSAFLGDIEEAHARAIAAMGELPPESIDVSDWNASAVLALFAQARQKAIADAVNGKQEWPQQWLADVHAARSVLARHPHGTDAQVAAHYDFLRALGATNQAAQALDDGIARFPDSPVLHDRLRGHLLAERGVAGLEAAYAERLQALEATPSLRWFAGYASIVAAEFHRRHQEDELALAAYDRAIAYFEQTIAAAPEGRESADHYIALSLAGRARVALENAEYERAAEEVLASFERRPEAAASLDGLTISPVGTARMLVARLNEAQRPELARTVQAGLDRLDPALLAMPEFERGGGPSPDARRFRRRGDGR